MVLQVLLLAVPPRPAPLPLLLRLHKHPSGFAENLTSRFCAAKVSITEHISSLSILWCSIGEDLSPATVEAEVLRLYKESPSRALKWFLERAEVFRGTDDLAYYMTNLVALTREYRETGVIRDLPAKGSQEALNIQKEHEEKQAQAMAAGAANDGDDGAADEAAAEQGALPCPFLI